MSRYLGFLSYKGTDYFGYQIQNEHLTVQSVLEKSLSTVLRSDINTKGSSRTDTGVHAFGNSFHFDYDGQLPELFIKRMNGVLSNDIALLKVLRVDDGLHARFSANERTYLYKVHFNKNPFLQGWSWQLFGVVPDFEKMNSSARHLLEFDDFACFSKTNTSVKTTLCDIREARWDKISEEEFWFTIKADRFLRGMVRGIVGTLIKVGKGDYSEDDFLEIIKSNNSDKTDFSAPAHGLYLQKVSYEGL